MSDEEIRIAIAEACGWMHENLTHCVNVWEPKHCFGYASKIHDEKEFFLLKIPDYTNDLNAMHEAVETLSIERRTEWPMHLRHIVVREAKYKDNPDTGLLDDTWFYNATARQRAEAFLRTLSKWKD